MVGKLTFPRLLQLDSQQWLRLLIFSLFKCVSFKLSVTLIAYRKVIFNRLLPSGVLLDKILPLDILLSEAQCSHEIISLAKLNYLISSDPSSPLEQH